MNVTSVSVLSIAAVLLFLPTNTEAAIYKCVAADGSISYNQKPCPVDEKTDKIMKGAGTRSASYDCRVADAFALHVAKAMRAGSRSEDVFNDYGGINVMPPTAVSIVSYIFGHKANNETPISRISALSNARCNAGAYSENLDCDDFPVAFIQKTGGCAAAKGEARAFNTATSGQLPDAPAGAESWNTGPDVGPPTSAGFDAGEGDVSANYQMQDSLSPAAARPSAQAEAEARAAAEAAAEEAQRAAARAAAAAAELNREFESETDADVRAKCRATMSARIQSLQEAMRDTSLTTDEYNRLEAKRTAVRAQHKEC